MQDKAFPLAPSAGGRPAGTEGMLALEAHSMEGQLELERRQTRRNRLHLVSAVAQWIILLSCLVYFGLGFLRPPTTPEAQWVKVGVKDYYPKEKRISVSESQGTMKVRNLSIPILCDGFYLVSLKGLVSKVASASLILTVYKRHDAPILCVNITKLEVEVDLVTVSEMQFKDEVYLEANREANYQDLTLSLFLLSAQPVCIKAGDEM
ncbi:tumor necrosis factor ligand superfamily member 4 [Pelodiscus sinensis]|uniref:tumor necrosis factor ligand superfamily member 4 n=1 Tax=Pelodiscus sinensis TaxID=13735 RepID=UPI0003C4C8A2